VYKICFYIRIYTIYINPVLLKRASLAVESTCKSKEISKEILFHYLQCTYRDINYSMLEKQNRIIRIFPSHDPSSILPDGNRSVQSLRINESVMSIM
jgi:hypothetical protein